jgi:hypothetical protein
VGISDDCGLTFCGSYAVHVQRVENGDARKLTTSSQWRSCRVRMYVCWGPLLTEMERRQAAGGAQLTHVAVFAAVAKSVLSYASLDVSESHLSWSSSCLLARYVARVAHRRADLFA